MKTFEEAIMAMTGSTTDPYDIILQTCLQLDGSNLSVKDVHSFLSGRSITLDMDDAKKIFVYNNNIEKHLKEISGYNICMELLRAMVLGSRGTLGFETGCLNETDALMQSLHEAATCKGKLEKAAKVYVAIVGNDAVRKHSAAIGYLMMLYSLKLDGYDLFIPNRKAIADMMSYTTDVQSPESKGEEILKDLKTYYYE